MSKKDKKGKAKKAKKQPIIVPEMPEVQPEQPQDPELPQDSEMPGADPEDVPTPKTPLPRLKVRYKECPIAGWSHHDLEDQWDELTVGLPLALVRDRNNQYDRNAVAVALAVDFEDYADDPDEFDFELILGYVPRADNPFIAALIDLGWEDALTAELTTVKSYGPYQDRLRMTIYLQSREGDRRYTLPQVYSMGTDDDLQPELSARGFLAFRWHLPQKGQQLPIEGDRIVAIHRGVAQASLYLLRVNAVGDKHAAPYLKSEGVDVSDNSQEDDCQPYIMTNVKGPAIVPLEMLDFLGVYAFRAVPDWPLPIDESARLMQLLGAD